MEQFLAHFPNRSVSSLSQKEVEGFSQQVKLKDWQFKQLVIALRILLVDLVSSDAGKSMDWQYWIDAAKQLEDFHPTLAGDHSIKASVAALSGSSTLNTAQRTLLEELSKCCREKHYSIRTERSYSQWCKRFFFFVGDIPSASLSSEHVNNFLSYLNFRDEF